jgi:hypothetical protein
VAAWFTPAAAAAAAAVAGAAVATGACGCTPAPAAARSRAAARVGAEVERATLESGKSMPAPRTSGIPRAPLLVRRRDLRVSASYCRGGGIK